MTWTDEQIEKLKSLWTEGLSCSQIGAQLGVTRNAVISKVHRLQLDGRMGPRAPYVPPVKPKIDRSRMGNRRKSLLPSVKLADAAGIKPLPARKAILEAPKGPGVILAELASNGCRFPVGEVEGIKGRHLFCNAERAGQSYCAFHDNLVGRSAPRPFTKEEDEKILSMWNLGRGLDHLAMALDRVKASVAMRARQLRAA